MGIVVFADCGASLCLWFCCVRSSVVRLDGSSASSFMDDVGLVGSGVGLRERLRRLVCDVASVSLSVFPSSSAFSSNSSRSAFRFGLLSGGAPPLPMVWTSRYTVAF